MADTRRRRGFETEELIAAYLRDHGFPHAEVARRGATGLDILGMPGIAPEVKARRGFDVQAAMRQAARQAGDLLPVVFLRPDGMGPATLDLWPAIIPIGRQVGLLRAAGYGEAEEAA